MAFAQNQVKANSTPNYFNDKSLFNNSDSKILIKFHENTHKDMNNNNTGVIKNSEMFKTIMPHSQNNFYMHEHENSQDSDEQENSILINNNNQHMSSNISNQHQHLYLTESKELIEINNRLGFYIDAVNMVLIYQKFII